MQLSYSKINCFKTCPKRYEMKYVHHMLEPESPELEVGNVGHEILEHYYKTNRSQESLEDLITLYGGKHADGLREIFDGYHAFASTHDEGITNIRTEIEYKRDLSEDGNDVLVGKLDVLANAGGQQIIIDHKFKGKWADTFEVNSQYEDQPKIYAWLTGSNLFFYNLIRTKPAKTRPKFERVPLLISENDKIEVVANLQEWVRLMKNAETYSTFPKCSGFMQQYCPCRTMEINYNKKLAGVAGPESEHFIGGNNASEPPRIV